MAKQSHNPFKMRGSWIGAIPGIILFLIFLVLAFTECWNPTGFAVDGCLMIPVGMAYGIILLIIGFLTGLGIHSLIRKLRKKK